MAAKPKINLLKTPLIKSLTGKPKKPRRPKRPVGPLPEYTYKPGPWKKNVTPPQESVWVDLDPENTLLPHQSAYAPVPGDRINQYLSFPSTSMVTGGPVRMPGTQAAYGQGSRTVEGYPLSFEGMGLKGQPRPEIKKQPRPIKKMSGGPLGTPIGYSPLGGSAGLSDAPGVATTPAPLLLPLGNEAAEDPLDSDEITGLIDSAFDSAHFNYSQDDKMLNTGPQGFAETFWRLSDPTRPPIISDTPHVTGPQVNRATGEITEVPLSWLSLDRTPENAIVGPEGPVVGGGDPVGPVGPIDDTDLWNSYDDSVRWSPSSPPEIWTPDTTGGIVDWNVDFGEDDIPVGYGWGTSVDDPSTLEEWLGFRYVDPSSEPAGPQLEPQPEDQLGTGYQEPIVIRHPRPISGETIQNVGGKPSLGGEQPFSPYKPSKASTILDASKNIATDVLGGIESMSDAIAGKTQYDQYPRPEKEKEVGRLLGKLDDLVQGWSDETFLLWEQQGVPSSLGDRTPFGPDYIENLKNLGKIIKNEEGIKTQEYGKLQYVAILNMARMVATYGPIGALPSVAVTLSKDIMSGLKNAFADHPEFRGNPVQDVIHGTTWVLGQTLEKTYNATLGKVIDKIDGEKIKEKLSKLNIIEGMKAPDAKTGVKITYTPPKTTRLNPRGGEPQMPVPAYLPPGRINPRQHDRGQERGQEGLDPEFYSDDEFVPPPPVDQTTSPAIVQGPQPQERQKYTETFGGESPKQKKNDPEIVSKTITIPPPEGWRGAEGELSPAGYATEPLPKGDIAQEELEFDPNGTGYDYKTAIERGLGPDETGHWPSRVPETGQILKGMNHETIQKTIDGERKAGYTIQKGEDGNFYSQPIEEVTGLDLEKLTQYEPIDFDEIERINSLGRVDPNAVPKKAERISTPEELEERERLRKHYEKVEQDEWEKEQRDKAFEDAEPAPELDTPIIPKTVNITQDDWDNTWPTGTVETDPLPDDEEGSFWNAPDPSKPSRPFDAVTGETPELEQEWAGGGLAPGEGHRLPETGGETPPKPKEDDDVEPKYDEIEYEEPPELPMPHIYPEYRADDPAAGGLYKIKFEDGTWIATTEGGVEDFLAKGGELVKWPGLPELDPDTLEELKDLGIKPADDLTKPYAQIMGDPISIKVAVDQYGRELDHTEAGFDKSQIDHFEYRDKQFPDRGKDDAAAGSEEANHKGEIGDLEIWVAEQKLNEPTTDPGQSEPEPNWNQVRGSDGKIYAKNPNGWKNPSNPREGLIDRYNSSTWSSTASWDTSLSDFQRENLPSGHPQHISNQPDHLKPLEGSPGGSGIFVDFRPTNTQVESAARNAGVPSSTYTLFEWTDWEGVPQSGYFDVPVSVEGSGRNWSWEYDYNNAGAPQGAKPAWGKRSGGTFTVEPGP